MQWSAAATLGQTELPVPQNHAIILHSHGSNADHLCAAQHVAQDHFKPFGSLPMQATHEPRNVPTVTVARDTFSARGEGGEHTVPLRVVREVIVNQIVGRLAVRIRE